MKVSLSPELKQFVEKKIEDGSYENKSEVMRDALRALIERDQVLHAQVAMTGKFPSVLAGVDVSEAAFLVMLMATKDMDDDIRTIMQEIKALTAAKQKLRQLIRKVDRDVVNNYGQKEPLSYLPDGMSSEEAYHGAQMPIPDPQAEGGVKFIQVDLYAGKIVGPAHLRSILDDLKGQLDGMNEMSEMTSLRLQMILDRRSKFISTLSNIMKKMSETQDVLVQNLK
jgi:putative addiction module CopG family antidote